MTLVAKQMARDCREPLRCSSHSSRCTQAPQRPSLRFLVAIVAIVGIANGPRGALAEVPPELSSMMDKPCPPSCQGQCFAGTCLFTGDEPVLLGSPTKSSIGDVVASHTSADGTSSVMPEPVLVELMQSAPVRNHGRLRRHGVRGAFPGAPTLAPMLAAAPSDMVMSAGAQPPRDMHAPNTAMQVDVQSHMAVDAPPLLLQRDSAAATLQQQPAPVALRQLQQAGAQQQLGLFDQPVRQVQLVQQLATQGFQSEQTLDATLKSEQQLEASLRAENGQLRAELIRWREAGARVADREAKVVNIISSMTRSMPRSEAPDQSARQTDVPRQSLLSVAVERYLFNEGKSPLEDSINGRRLMLIFFTVNALAFLLWALAPPPGPPVMTARKGVGSRPGLLEAVLRQAGLGSYIMEVSELQARNLCICGEAHLSLRMGTEPEVRVEATDSLEGDLVKFDTSFTFRVHASHPEGNCVIWVMDRDPLSEEERIAHLEVPMRDLLQLVQREHGEYVTFDLETHGPQSKRRLLGAQTAKPCLALRLRDVTMVPQHKVMQSSSPSHCQVRSGSALASQRKLEDVAEPQ